MQIEPNFITKQRRFSGKHQPHIQSKWQTVLPIGRHHLYMGGYTAWNEAESEMSFKGLKCATVNTMCVPIYWDQIEPEKGKYDFASVDTLIKLSRKYEVKLIFLWFAH